jgi:hypothetical protein
MVFVPLNAGKRKQGAFFGKRTKAERPTIIATGLENMELLTIHP